MMTLDDADLHELSTIVGTPVLAAEACSWGFENRTAIVTLAEGRRLIVQRITNRALAPHKMRLARVLPDYMAAAGLRAPQLLAADATVNPPYIVREYLPGEPAASLMDSVDGAIHVARAMGALLPQLATVSTADAALQSHWADPVRLARQAYQQLDRCRALLDDTAITALVATIDALPARFADRPACFAHGDFCPVNALMEAGDSGLATSETNSQPATPRIVALLDLELARSADPLFDAAWWGWVVRYHHYERWVPAWPQLLAAAGIPHDEPTLARVQALQRLRCLEMLDDCARTQRVEAATMWAARLVETLGWG